jgi:hypothetical protein
MIENPRRRVRLFGVPQSADAYALRDYLQRSVVAFDWVELSSDTDQNAQLGFSDLKNVRLPMSNCRMADDYSHRPSAKSPIASGGFPNPASRNTTFRFMARGQLDCRQRFTLHPKGCAPW